MEAANNLAFLLADQKYNDPKSLEKAATLIEAFANSEDPHLLDTVAWVYFRQGRFEKAHNIMKKVMKASEKLSPAIYYHQGSILAQKGDTEGAKVALTIATKENPSFSGYYHAQTLLKKLSE